MKHIEDMDIEGTIQYYKAKAPTIRVTGGKSMSSHGAKSLAKFEK